jgi:hypothetical protein
MSDSKRPMAERILDCFPAGAYALGALLRLLDVVETEEVSTAAVECCLQPRLLINPKFVDAWAPTPEKLLMLVMHELHHVLLGHTRLFPRVTSVDNLVFDAVINSLLCRMFPAPEHTRFFTDFYSDQHFPDCLLRPVAGWPFDDVRGNKPNRARRLPPALHDPDLRPAAEVYLALYSPRGATYHDLYEALRRLVTEALAALVPLLGDHGPGGTEKDTASGGNLGERSPGLFDAVRQIVERWPQPPDPIAGRSLADILKKEAIVPRHRPPNRAVLRGLLRKVGGVEPGHGIARTWADDPTAILTPIPTCERRAVVLRALGAPPLLYGSTLPLPRRRPAGERVHVYLDVSGSIGHLKAALYGAVLDCGDAVHRVVHLFSTRVVDVSLDDLRRGRCETTGGTAIDCVAEHMSAHRVCRAVLVTDGYVGKPAGTHRETLHGVRLGVALTPTNPSRADLEEVADFWAQLV